jgi:death-on-curing protein
VIELHDEQIQLFGGSPGLRDRGLLKAALAMPQQSFAGQYVHEDIPAMATAYLFHLSKNHPFVDGNKRIAAFATDIFLELNGFELTLTNDEYTDMVLAVAAGKMGKDELISRLRAAVKVAG